MALDLAAVSVALASFAGIQKSTRVGCGWELEKNCSKCRFGFKLFVVPLVFYYSMTLIYYESKGMGEGEFHAKSTH